MASSSAPAEEDMELMRIGRTIFQSKDLLSGTCRRDAYCIRCGVAFCSHCCRFHHHHVVVSRWYDPLLRVDLDGGRPVLPTRTADGRHALPRRVAACMAAQDYTSRLPRDAFCTPCGASFRADLCSHHDVHTDATTGEPLADAVVRIEEHGGHGLRVVDGPHGRRARRPRADRRRRGGELLRASPGAEGDGEQLPPLR